MGAGFACRLARGFRTGILAPRASRQFAMFPSLWFGVQRSMLDVRCFPAILYPRFRKSVFICGWPSQVSSLKF